MPLIQILSFGMIAILLSFLSEGNINIKFSSFIKYLGFVLILVSSIEIIYSLVPF